MAVASQTAPEDHKCKEAEEDGDYGWGCWVAHCLYRLLPFDFFYLYEAIDTRSGVRFLNSRGSLGLGFPRSICLLDGSWVVLYIVFVC